MSRAKWMVGLAAAALVMGSVATAGERAGRKAAGEGGVGDRPMLRKFLDVLGKMADLREELNLTPEQKQKIAEVLKEHKDEIKTAVQTVHEKRKALMGAVRADTVNEGTIRQAATALGTALGDASVVRANVRQEVLAVLTPEQRAKIDAAIAEAEKAGDDMVNQIGAE